MIAFDADVLIYAATPGHPIGRRVITLFEAGDDSAAEQPAPPVGTGSLVLLPELLSWPIRNHADDEAEALYRLLARLELRPVDEATATLAAILGARRNLKAADAIHLATAVQAGADQFLTNNADDFGADIDEIDIVYPDRLPEP